MRITSGHGAREVALMSQRPWVEKPTTLACLLGVTMLAVRAGEASAVLKAIVAVRLRGQLTPPDGARRIGRYH